MSKMGRPPKPLSERFWSRVDRRGPDECWPWTGSLDRDGYGVITDEGGRQLRAHRVSYAMQSGEVPTSLVCHSCDNRPCCNPAHLWPGSTQANTADRDAKGRQRSGRFGRRKLTEDQALAIRSALGTQQEISVLFGISRSQISQIKSGKAWTHLGGAQ